MGQGSLSLDDGEIHPVKQALHDRIRSDFESRIIAGELAPGDRLPTEHELVQTYDCSRATVNKALSALLAAGLIDRRKKAGTFVARPRVHSMILDVPDLAVQIRERGQAYDYITLSRRLRQPHEIATNELLPEIDGKLMQFEGLHSADGIPLALESRLVNIDAVPGIAEADVDHVSPGSWLIKYVPWTEAETRISAVVALGDEARLLCVPAGSPCLCVERRTWRGSDHITYVRQIFVGSAYDLVARFGPAASSLSGDIVAT